MINSTYTQLKEILSSNTEVISFKDLVSWLQTITIEYFSSWVYKEQTISFEDSVNQVTEANIEDSVC